MFEIEQVVDSFEVVKADSEKEVIGVPGVEETKLVEDATLLPARSDDLERVVIRFEQFVKPKENDYCSVYRH